jgi:Concanavalin A-like lectin/glucanases superfamily
MRHRASIAIAAASLVGVATLLTEPAAATAPAHRPPQGTRLLLTFDHHESLKAGTMVRDSSGFRHPGTIIASHVPGLRAVRGSVLRGAGFPGVCRGCGHAIVEVADAKGLNPLRKPFVFGSAVRVGPKRAVEGSNFIQKGRYNQAGGQYKLNLRPGGIPRCVVRGALGRVVVMGRATIADGAWHRVSCLRTPTGVRLRVDGKRVAAAQGATGLVVNDGALRLGGRKAEAPNRQFHGALDTAFVRLLPRP